MSLALLFNSPSSPSILAQETTGHGTSSPLSKAYTSSVTAGNLLVIAATDTNGTGGASLGVSDSLGNTYTQVATGAVSGIGLSTIWCAVASGSGTNTVSFTSTVGSPNLFVYLNEFYSSVGWDSSPFDVADSASGTGLTASSPSVTTAVNGELIFGFFPNGIQTGGSGYTVITDANAVEYKLQTTAGTVSASGAQFVSGAWQAFIATFKPFTSGGSGGGGATFIQGTNGGWNADLPIVVDFPGDVTAGNTLIVMMMHSYTGCPPSVTDTQGNTYTSCGDPSLFSPYLWVFTAVAGSTGSNTVTVSAACGFSNYSFFTEWSGLDVSPFDQENVNDNTTAPTATTGSITTTADGELVLSAWSGDISMSWTPGGGATQILTNSSGGAMLQMQIQTTAGSVNPTASASNFSGSFPGYGYVASFKVAASANSFTKALSEAFTLVEAFSRKTGRAFTEPVTITDVLLRLTSKHASDSLTITETITKTAGRYFTEAISITEKIAKTVGHSITEAISITEHFGKAVGYVLADSFSLVDLISKTAKRTITETFTLADSLLQQTARLFTKLLSDSLVLSDSVSRYSQKQISDSLSLNDQLLRGGWKLVADGFTLTEQIAKNGHKVYADAFILAENINRSGQKKITDTFSLVEHFIRGVSRYTSDSLAITDYSVTRLGQKALIETLTVTEAMHRASQKAVNDTFSFVELIVRSSSKYLADSLSLADVISKARATTLLLIDSFILSELVTRSTARSVIDSLTLSDAVEVMGGKILIFLESFTISENIQKSISHYFSDSFSLAELFAKARSSLFALADTLLVSDAIHKLTGRKVTDSFSLADVLAYTRAKVLALVEAFTLSDSITRSAIRNFIDAISIFEIFSSGGTKFIAFLEAIALSDQITRKPNKVSYDAIAIADKGLVRHTTHEILDPVLINEWLSKWFDHVFNDALSITDRLIKGLDVVSDALRIYFAQVLARIFSAEIPIQCFVAEVVPRAYTAGAMVRNWTANEDIMIYADLKDAESTEDFQIDWSAVIGSDVITDSSWEVPSELTNVSSRNTATTATIRLSGGIAGKRYALKNIVTLESGQIKVQSMQLPVV